MPSIFESRSRSSSALFRSVSRSSPNSFRASSADWTSCDGYFQAVFYRGTEFLNAIRSSMGDDAFFAAIRDWVSRNRGGFVTGERLLRHLQGWTDADLRPIYSAYLAQPVALRLRGAPAGAFPD